LKSRRIKVLQLLATMPVGGAEDLVAAVVKGLNPEKFEVAAACIGEPGTVGQELRAAGYAVASLGLNLKRTSAWRLVAAVRRLLREAQPDLLHTHLYHPNLYGRLAALGLGLKGVVASVHNSYTAVKWHRRFFNYLLGWTTDRVVAVSSRVWEDVRRYDGIPAARLYLLPNGIDLAALETGLTREEAKARLGVKGFCLGAAGRLEEQKGHVHLLEALPQLKKEIPGVVLLLAGAGRLGSALEGRARELGVEGTVRFLGLRRDMPCIYRAVDLFVQPSLWEGLPLALLQAMGAGLPVVATEVGGSLEVIEDGVNGRLVPPGRAGELAGAILELYRQPEARARMGEEARQTVAARYSQEVMLRRLESLYLEVLRDKGRKGEAPAPWQAD
jgi:glycosyltransferase involved in cell wall biosynthesis